MNFRTDLAIENKEIYDADNECEDVEIMGVEVDTDKFRDVVSITRIKNNQRGRLQGHAKAERELYHP